jgi:hypothetical protein
VYKVTVPSLLPALTTWSQAAADAVVADPDAAVVADDPDAAVVAAALDALELFELSLPQPAAISNPARHTPVQSLLRERDIGFPLTCGDSVARTAPKKFESAIVSA